MANLNEEKPKEDKENTILHQDGMYEGFTVIRAVNQSKLFIAQNILYQHSYKLVAKYEQ